MSTDSSGQFLIRPRSRFPILVLSVIDGAMINLKPRAYQLPAVRWMYDHPVGALFGDLGSGKTIVVLALIETLRQTEYGKTLLIAPKNVKDLVWRQEAKKFYQFQDLKFSTAFAPNANVHLVNPESLHKVPDWGAYANLIIDESTDFKNYASIRFKKLSERLYLFRRRYILTAGPIPNGYHDMWAQIYILDEGERLGKNITAYRNRYFRKNEYGFGYEELPGAAEQIETEIADLCFRIDLAEYPEVYIPERHDITVSVDLGPENMAIYKSLERDLVAELESETVTALSAAELYGKCKQFTGGFLYSWPEWIPKKDRKSKHRKTHWVHREKLHALGALHNEIGRRPALVVYQHEAEGRAISRRFSCPLIHGGSKGREDTVLAWNAGKLPMLAAQIGTIARGLNLQFGGRDMVVYSIPDNMDHYFQVRGRLHRPGAEQTVNIYHLVATDTVDEMKLAPRLGKKLSRQKALLDALTSHFRGHR